VQQSVKGVLCQDRTANNHQEVNCSCCEGWKSK